MTEALVAIDSIEHDLELREEFKPQASHNMTTTTIASESFTSEVTPAEQVVAALRVLGVDLVLEPVTEIKATGTTTRIDAYLHKQMKDHRQDLIEMVKDGALVVDTARETLDNATTWEEVETALAKVIDAFDGHLLGYDSIEDFSSAANAKAKAIPAAGAVF